MVLRIWIWRISLVLLVLFMSMGFYRLSLHSFRSLFGAQVIESPYSYPSFQVFQKDLPNDQSLITITLQHYESFLDNPAPPQDLFFMLQGGDRELRSDDQQRIDGYPFLQVSTSDPFSFELLIFHQLGTETLLIKKVSFSEALASSGTLKGAAPVLEIPKTLPEPLQLWHWIAVGMLVGLGSLYVSVRYQSLRSQSP